MKTTIQMSGVLACALFALSIPTVGANTEEAPQASFAAVDALFADYDSTETPGCALGVIREGEFIYRRGYGMANLEHGVPISSQSVFRIGSTSKQFTAAAIALLAEQGQLALDDPLKKYYPDFPAWADEVTIDHLVHHTSGIRDYLTLAYLAGKGDDPDYYTTDWAIALIGRQLETNFPPGTRFFYSNSGYLLMGNIVEKVSGMSLKEFSEQNIFGPLTMEHSHFHDDHTHIVPHRAAGYAPAGDGYRISMTTLDIVGDGGVYTSVDDLLLWDRNFYKNHLGTQGQALIEQLTTPASLANGEPMDYAFGLTREQYRGQTLISHGGAFVGFRAEMVRFPELNFSVAVLCNRSDAAASVLALGVADQLLADKLEPRPEASSERESFELDAEQLHQYAGDFWEPSAALAAETRLEDGKLWAIHSPERRNQLVAVGENRFQMIGLPYDVIVEYKMTDTGEVQSVHRFIQGKARGVFIPFERRQAKEDELTEYRGGYYSPELNVEYLIGVSDDHLLVQFEDEAAQELTPMFDDTFENPDLGAFEFQRTPEGTITGLKLQSGRVRNLMFDKKM